MHIYCWLAFFPRACHRFFIYQQVYLCILVIMRGYDKLSTFVIFPNA